MPMPTMTPEKFWSKAIKIPEHPCWEWGGYMLRNGYGIVGWDRQQVLAHRMAWSLASGHEIPEGMCICHRCDNKACINPDHLFLGSQQDNVDDCKAKGRRAYAPRGKLAIATIHEIRALKGTAASDKIARRFGVAGSTVRRIWQGTRWGDIK